MLDFECGAYLSHIDGLRHPGASNDCARLSQTRRINSYHLPSIPPDYVHGFDRYQGPEAMHVSTPQLSTAAFDGLGYLALRERAAAFIRNYPDIYTLAYQAARHILEKHTGNKSFNPARVYWHRFSGASNSSRTFTGWQHGGRPSQSLTLIELVMHRFSAADQDAPDDLNVYSGFYTVGADGVRYDEQNEVPMLPSDVLRDFWTMDFASACKHKVEAFWREHGDEFCAFTKARLLASAGVALSKRQLAPDDFQAVLAAVTGGDDPRVTWAMLQTRNRANHRGSVHVFELAGHAARDMLYIRSGSGRVIVYQADARPAFRCFDDDHALGRWITAQMSDPASKAALASHFVRGQAQQTDFAKKVSRAGNRAINMPAPGQAASTWVFEQLRDRAQEEMREDVHTLLTGNASLRKQMWIGYLGAFIQVAGAFAPIGWPVALTLVGAGVASIGLNIDQAINGRTAPLRKSGVVGAIVNSIYLLFNLPLLADIRGLATSISQLEHEAVDGLEALEALEGNAILPPATSLTDASPYRGIHVLENGENWISLNDRSFRVQYVADLKLWFIVNPDNPFSFSGAHLVRFNEANEWELVGAPGLRGGGSMEPSGSVPPPFERVTSSFWDTYMQFNVSEERRLSEVGNQRQESLTSIYEVVEDDSVFTDSEGDEVAIDSFGEKHRIFKTAHDWFGGTITLFTRDEDAYNVFLRTGARKGPDQVGVISRLLEDLAEVGHNNDVPLYRGGSGHRGTSGQAFRDGQFKAGDVLVNTDFTSFSENPYISRVFASSQAGAASESFMGDVSFDNTSIVFELPAKQYLSATPISPFSVSPEEVESVFVPGNYFEIQRVQEVMGTGYRFMNVQLKQIPLEQVTGAVYDLRTGMPFSRDQFAARLGAGAETLVDSLFPPATS
ncbi:ADP-ribosylating toxin [Pseudomonas sp. GD03842]|uniref:dermonecrotic toxin domain-containing protein n=1 Tax=Pseudomonas sp. GD03842 TaxID=2975385 RepID=UPI002449A994|nr:DUF6543 domain-containing protein [Pseudomonas sp. GD03842]MDH0746523.1 ADP-ribosylating toxin [Pseudomonas sp. GD03842]